MKFLAAGVLGLIFGVIVAAALAGFLWSMVSSIQWAADRFGQSGGFAVLLMWIAGPGFSGIAIGMVFDKRSQR